MQELDTLSKYGQSFQSKVLSALLVDGKFLDTISEITTAKFFENDANKWIISEILDYHSEYKKPPTLDVFKSLIINGYPFLELFFLSNFIFEVSFFFFFFKFDF